MNTPEFLPHRDVLFIDIDRTLLDFHSPPPTEGRNSLFGHSLLWLMREEALAQHQMPPEKAERILRGVLDNIRWWHWTDFIRALDLDAARFWQRAYEAEAEYLGPVDPLLSQHMDRLLMAGFQMFITSNNASNGILHKLRLAGLGEMWGSKYFLQYMGPPEFRAMKSEPEFWLRALTHTGLVPDRITVIGDSWDGEILPAREAGISSGIHLDWDWRDAPAFVDGAWKAGNWTHILELLLAGNNGGNGKTQEKPRSRQRQMQASRPAVASALSH